MSDDPLTKLRAPFAANHISKLPKESKAQIDERKANRSAGISCKICGGWHHKNAVHLDYVGHAALTDRLLDTDLGWTWEPVAFGQDGLPAVDRNGGLWIKLTICNVTRLGYGAADGKSGGDAVKEIIGDALRNAAMRFGAALDLWHKGDLHVDPPEETVAAAEPAERSVLNPQAGEQRQRPAPLTGKHKTRESLKQAWGTIVKELSEAADGGDEAFVDEVLLNWSDDIEQIETEGNPTWTNHPEWGLNAQIAAARTKCQQPAT